MAASATATPSAPDVAAAWRFPNRATPPGSSAYYSVRLAPSGLRDDLAAVLAWHHEVRAVLYSVSDPGVAAAKLQWWAEELGRTSTGEARHPLSLALALVMTRHQLPPPAFLRLTEQTQSDLAGQAPTDQSALEAGCEADLGTLFELLARCHGITDAEPLTAARRLGGFCAQVYLIRDSGMHLRRGRPFLPADRLAEQGLSHQALAGPEHSGQLPGLLAESAAAALTYRNQGAASPAGLPSSLPSSLRVRGRILAALLAELKAEGFDVARRRVGLTPLRKLWLGWREARRGD